MTVLLNLVKSKTTVHTNEVNIIVSFGQEIILYCVREYVYIPCLCLQTLPSAILEHVQCDLTNKMMNLHYILMLFGKCTFLVCLNKCVSIQKNAIKPIANYRTCRYK